jgi:DNA-binding response OmpR family regulator
VLVADDEPSMLALLSAYIRSKGYRVLEASDGDMAWQLAHEHLPNVVVLDVMMPGMSGWEVCKKIRESVSLAHTGVVMLTGIGENLNELTSPLYGADAYIDKPFEFAELEARIKETLERRRDGALGRPDGGAEAEDDEESEEDDEESEEEESEDDGDEDLEEDEEDEDEPRSKRGSQEDEPITQRLAKKPGAPKRGKKASRKPAVEVDEDENEISTDAQQAIDDAQDEIRASRTKAKKKAGKKAAGKKASKKAAGKKAAGKKAAGKKAAGKKASKKAAGKKASKKAAGKKAAGKKASKKAAGKKASKKAAGKASKKAAGKASKKAAGKKASKKKASKKSKRRAA